jgi:hypothetical protein
MHSAEASVRRKHDIPTLALFASALDEDRITELCNGRCSRATCPALFAFGSMERKLQLRLLAYRSGGEINQAKSIFYQRNWISCPNVKICTRNVSRTLSYWAAAVFCLPLDSVVNLQIICLRIREWGVPTEGLPCSRRAKAPTGGFTCGSVRFTFPVYRVMPGFFRRRCRLTKFWLHRLTVID